MGIVTLVGFDWMADCSVECSVTFFFGDTLMPVLPARLNDPLVKSMREVGGANAEKNTDIGLFCRLTVADVLKIRCVLYLLFGTP
jgi:hypothetical protein